MIEQYKETLKRVIARRPNGFTFNLRSNSFPNSGYAVASAATQDCIGKSGLFRVLKYCMRHPQYCVGCWVNEDGEMQYDATMIYRDFSSAIAAAIANKQRAIFNLYTGREIMECDYNSSIAA